MDITLWLDDDSNTNEKSNKKNDNIVVNPIVKSHIKTYMEYINMFGRKNKLSLEERVFMLNYAQKGGSLINVSLFNEIVQKLNLDGDTKFTDLCNIMFEKFMNYDLTKIKNDLISSVDYIEFTKDQNDGMTQMLNFLSDKNRKIFGLYGYAGTGKTTTMVELISFLIIHGYIKSIALSAPTNKAVNIMKSKMRTNLKTICEKYIGRRFDNGSSNNGVGIDEMLELLVDHGIKIDFITIHRLLNYKNDFNTEGDRIFLKSGKSLLNEYDLVIVDECSMISLQIIINLLEETTGNNKIIFSGDNIQLPPVNEKKSMIFIKDKAELSYDIFTKTIQEIDKITVSQKLDNFVSTQKRYERITSDIVNMDFIILKEVMRNRIGNVVNLCYNIREWVDNIVKVPNLNKFNGQGVYMYKCTDKDKKNKIKTKWFDKFVELQRQNNLNQMAVSNIILTWTNEQTNVYNNEIRKIMFGTTDVDKLEKYEIGDILMLGDFYNFDEKCVKGQDNKNRFYTSEQIKITDKDTETKTSGDFTELITQNLVKMKNSNHILTEYKKLIKNLNASSTRHYYTYKLYVQKLAETLMKDKIAEVYTVYVVHDTHKELLEHDKKITASLIRKFRVFIADKFKENLKRVDREMIRPLWRSWNKIFIDPFANVNYGNSHSVHKSQGSSFYNVFVDCDDILNNSNEDEAKRCIYTAFTRSSNELYVLL